MLDLAQLPGCVHDACARLPRAPHHVDQGRPRPPVLRTAWRQHAPPSGSTAEPPTSVAESLVPGDERWLACLAGTFFEAGQRDRFPLALGLLANARLRAIPTRRQSRC